MARQREVDLAPILFTNLHHSLAEWLENRIQRATFAAIAIITTVATAEQQPSINADEVQTLLHEAVINDCIYALRINRAVAALFCADSKAILVKFCPSTGLASFEQLDVAGGTETDINSILESMINKGTIDSFSHIESEEYLVMSEMLCTASQTSQTSTSNDDDCDVDDSDVDDDDDFAEPHGWFGDDGHYYDPESWAESHYNPPGTIDCGDGYLTDDGVFIEY